MDELAEERKTVKGLQEQLVKANQRALAKDLELLQLGGVRSKELKKKELIAVESLLTESKLGNPFKSLKEGGIMMHRRGNSDELALRPSSSKIKKKTSTIKK
jgi:DNA-binding HxlR family transcriptional regulator